MKTVTRFGVSITVVLWLVGTTLAQAKSHEIDFNFVPARTTINFTLGDVLHTVHGTFDAKNAVVHFDPATNKLSGEIRVDAASGHSGSNGRDQRMHDQVLESARYPDIVFRPDRVEGQVATLGTSLVQAHGMFTIHGAEHEMTIPVRIEMGPDGWTVTLDFAVPYVKWGMKNPSTFLLRVDQSVDIQIQASGQIS